MRITPCAGVSLLIGAFVPLSPKREVTRRISLLNGPDLLPWDVSCQAVRRGEKKRPGRVYKQGCPFQK